MMLFRILAAGMFLLAAGPPPPPSAVLRDALWTDPSGDLAKTLTEAPAECLARPVDATTARQMAIGRILFRSAGILGGPAARLGLSCNACHPNGHANAAFDLPELTDRPGAADVTAEWASAVRGDAIMNPVPIPDLTDVGARTLLGHKREPSLAGFVNGVVTEEFQGRPLPEPAMSALLLYLRLLRSADCPSTASAPITLSGAAEEVREALDGLGQAGDRPTAQLLLLGAQEALGRIAERLPPSHFAKERAALAELAREIASRRARSPALPVTPIPSGWMARFDGLLAALRPREAETYFNAATLRAALASRPR